jgi:hypothetical protein
VIRMLLSEKLLKSSKRSSGGTSKTG